MLLLLGALIIGGAGISAVRLFGPGLGVSLPGAGASSAVDAFLRGNQTYDAELVWNAYSDDARERLRSRGTGLEELKRQLALARERGSKIEEATFVGSQQLPNGLSMHFYLVRVANGQTQAQAQRDYVPYAFTLDGSGKITRVQ